MELNEFDKNMTAITFAEAGEHITARQVLAESEQKKEHRFYTAKNKPVFPMVAFGALSLTLYAALLLKQVVCYYTAIISSLQREGFTLHGQFARPWYFLSSMGRLPVIF